MQTHVRLFMRARMRFLRMCGSVAVDDVAACGDVDCLAPCGFGRAPVMVAVAVSYRRDNRQNVELFVPVGMSHPRIVCVHTHAHTSSSASINAHSLAT